MDTIFINSEECKASNTQKLLYDLTDKKDLKRVKKSIALTNLSIYYTWKNIIKINLEYLLQHEMIDLNYQMNHITYQVSRIILSTF